MPSRTLAPSFFRNSAVSGRVDVGARVEQNLDRRFAGRRRVASRFAGRVGGATQSCRDHQRAGPIVARQSEVRTAVQQSLDDLRAALGIVTPAKTALRGTP